MKISSNAIDNHIVTSLNNWGTHERTLVTVFSNDVVYLVILASALSLLVQSVKQIEPITSYGTAISKIVKRFIFIFAVPVGISTIISEVFSQIYVRQRPFIGMSHIKLLVPHGADGGMPSHHMVFMIAIVTMVFIYNRSLSLILAALTVLSGIARVAAGIHYPSDVIAGMSIGWLVATLYLRICRKRSIELTN